MPLPLAIARPDLVASIVKTYEGPSASRRITECQRPETRNGVRRCDLKKQVSNRFERLTTHGHTSFHSRGSFGPDEESLDIVVSTGI